MPKSPIRKLQLALVAFAAILLLFSFYGSYLAGPDSLFRHHHTEILYLSMAGVMGSLLLSTFGPAEGRADFKSKSLTLLFRVFVGGALVLDLALTVYRFAAAHA